MDPMAMSIWGEMVTGMVLWCGGAITGEARTSPEFSRETFPVTVGRREGTRMERKSW